MSIFGARHYDAIAALLKKQRAETWLDDPHNKYVPDDGGALLHNVVVEFSELFEQDNERFDPDRFYRACGFDPREISDGVDR